MRRRWSSTSYVRAVQQDFPVLPIRLSMRLRNHPAHQPGHYRHRSLALPVRIKPTRQQHAHHYYWYVRVWRRHRLRKSGHESYGLWLGFQLLFPDTAVHRCGKRQLEHSLCEQPAVLLHYHFQRHMRHYSNHDPMSCWACEHDSSELDQSGQTLRWEHQGRHRQRWESVLL